MAATGRTQKNAIPQARMYRRIQDKVSLIGPQAVVARAQQ